MTDWFSHVPAMPDFTAIQRELQAHLDQLRHWSGQATPAQIAAFAAIGDFILQAGRQQSEWGRLRLIAMRGRGTFLRTTQRLRGRRKKVSEALDTSRSLEKLGYKDRRSVREMLIADIPQSVFDRYLAEERYPTESGLKRFATLKGDHAHGYHLIPDPRFAISILPRLWLRLHRRESVTVGECFVAAGWRRHTCRAKCGFSLSRVAWPRSEPFHYCF
jgi:hypothetical protein